MESSSNQLAEVDSSIFFNTDSLGVMYVGFHKSSSKNFELVLAMLGGATHKAITIINNKEMYVGGFKLKDPVQAGILRSLILTIKNWKGVLISLEGRIISFTHNLELTLDCIRIANKCDNHLAHCLYSLKSWEKQQYHVNKDILLPCKKLNYFGHLLDAGLPVDLRDQLQAKAVKNDVDWCPYFDMENLKITEPNQPPKYDEKESESSLLSMISKLIEVSRKKE